MQAAMCHVFMLSVGDYTLKMARSKDKLAADRRCGAIDCWFSADVLTVPVTQGIKNTDKVTG